MTTAAPVRAFLALGGNVGDSRATLDRAVAMLADTPGVALAARSSDYRTPPWGVTDQAPFVNLVVAVDITLAPQALLARMQEIERALGRDRASEQRWGPRTVDLDLIAYGAVTLDEPGLVLPHPRLFERAFVLVPLAEISGGVKIGGRNPREALDGLDTGGIERLPPRKTRGRGDISQ